MLVAKEPQAHPVSQVNKDLLAIKGHQVLLVYRARQALTVHKVHQDFEG